MEEEMNLTLKRNNNTSSGIFGTLTDPFGDVVAVTLEHAYLLLNTYEPKIPPGTYICVRGEHQLHGMLTPFNTFEITGVPGHTNLLFHAGNFNADSEGCVLLGHAVDGDMVTSSKITFAHFMALQDDAQQFTLEVV